MAELRDNSRQISKLKEKLRIAKVDLSKVQGELALSKVLPTEDGDTEEKVEELKQQLKQAKNELAMDFFLNKANEVKEKDKIISRLSDLCEKSSKTGEKQENKAEQLQQRIDELKKQQTKIKKHPNHHGKRLPSYDVDVMHTRLEMLDKKNDFIEIRRGRLLVNVKNVSCRGYPSECGTNIIVPEGTKFPENILKYVERNSHTLLEQKRQREEDSAAAQGEQPHQKTKQEEAEELYSEFVKTLVYTSLRDHQGPIYMNGRKPFYRKQWTMNKDVTKNVMLCDQPDLVVLIFEAADKLVPIKGSLESHKAITARILADIANWHNKHATLVFKPGLTGGQTIKKMIVPTSFKPNAEEEAKNNSLDKVPPIADGRRMEPPIYGETRAKVERAKKEKTSVEPKEKRRKIEGSKTGEMKEKDEGETVENGVILDEMEEKEKGGTMKKKDSNRDVEKKSRVKDSMDPKTLALLRSLKKQLK